VVFIDGNSGKSGNEKEKWTTVPPKAFELWTKKKNGNKTYQYCQYCKYCTLHQPGQGKNCKKRMDPLADLLQSFGGGHNNASVGHSWPANQGEKNGGGFTTKGTSGFGSPISADPSIFGKSRSCFGSNRGFSFGGGQTPSPIGPTRPPFEARNFAEEGSRSPSTSPCDNSLLGPTRGLTEKKMIGSAAFGFTSEPAGPVFGSSSGFAAKPYKLGAEKSSGGSIFGSCVTATQTSSPFGRSESTFQQNNQGQNSSRGRNLFQPSVPTQPNSFSFSAPKTTQTFGAVAAPLFGSSGSSTGAPSQQSSFQFPPYGDQNSFRGDNSFNLSAAGQSKSFSFFAPAPGAVLGSPANLSGPQSTQQNGSSFRFPVSEQRQPAPAQGETKLSPLGCHTSPFVSDQKLVPKQTPSTAEPPSFQLSASDAKQPNLFQTEAGSSCWPPRENSTTSQPLFSAPAPASQPLFVPQVVTPPPVPALVVPAVVGPSELLSIQIAALDAKRKAMEKYLVR